MTELLQQAIAELKKLPVEQQNAIAIQSDRAETNLTTGNDLFSA